MSDTLFTVSGSWPFPHEMLRHDGAVPASKADGDIISKLMCELDDNDPLRAGDQIVALVLRNANGRSPDEAAWAEAGWSVRQEYIL